MDTEKKSMKARIVAIISAGALAASMAAMPALAFADNSASAGAQTGTGTTELTMITAVDNAEHDATSDNLSFTFPSQLNYVINAAGALTGPSANFSTPTAVIDNNSNFKIHVSSVDVDSASGWNIVAANDYTAATAANTVKLSIGPDGNQIDAGTYLEKTAGTDNLPAAKQWGMDANGAASHADMVGLGSSGNAKNVTADITTAKTFGTINWYVKAGPAPSTGA